MRSSGDHHPCVWDLTQTEENRRSRIVGVEFVKGIQNNENGGNPAGLSPKQLKEFFESWWAFPFCMGGV